jgi:predicted PhzF superfamily epimerase YddE/YHI9
VQISESVILKAGQEEMKAANKASREEIKANQERMEDKLDTATNAVLDRLGATINTGLEQTKAEIRIDQEEMWAAIRPDQEMRAAISAIRSALGEFKEIISKQEKGILASVDRRAQSLREELSSEIQR